MKESNEVKNYIILFIMLGILPIVAGVGDFAISQFYPEFDVLYVLFLILSGAFCLFGVFSIVILIVSMVKLKRYRKSELISKEDNQEKIDSVTAEKDKQSSENDLNNEKTKETPQVTHYAEDSLLLLTYIKDKCSSSEPEALSEDEKEQLDKKLSNAVNNVLINRLARNSICIYNPSDGIDQYPYGNWIEVKKSVKLKDAINLYLELKDYVRNNKEEVPTTGWHPYEIWQSNLTFFIVDNNIDLSDIDDKFAEKLKLNNIHLVALEDELKYVDIIDSTKYILNYYEQPCGVDWSGTEGYYNLTKIDNESKSDEERLSDKILCEILLNRAEIEYKYDSVLNQINLRIPIDKNSLYFLTVRVNASNGIVEKFSCEIKDGDDFHSDFSVSDAEKIKMLCISRLPYNRYIYEKSLDALLTELLKQYGERVLIHLIAHKSMFTSVEVLDVEESDNEKKYSRKYELQEPMQTDSMIAVAKEFESESFKFAECYCATFDDKGRVLHRIYYTIDDIAKIDVAPSPYVTFYLNYCDRKTEKYSFSLVSHVNSDVLSYIVDKKRLLCDM